MCNWTGSRNCAMAVAHGIFSILVASAQAQTGFLSPNTINAVGVGASLPAELYQQAAFAYQFENRVARISYTATGSTTGKNAIKGESSQYVVDFAGSDSLLSASDMSMYPDLQMYPSVGAAIVPIYNIPGMTVPLILSREVLPKIFLGDVWKWNDPEIQNLNPGVALPNVAIRVCVRSDGSGTSEIFTKALVSFNGSSSKNSFKTRVGAHAKPDWCEGQTVGTCAQSFGLCTCNKSSHDHRLWSFTQGKKNLGVVAAVQSQPYSIGYSVFGQARARQVQIASMRNRAGVVVKATPDGIKHAEMELGSHLGVAMTADLVDASSSNAWPIAAYTYFILRRATMVHNCAARRTTLDFLEWFYNSGVVESLAGHLGFAVLPDFVRKLVLQRMFSEVRCSNSGIWTTGPLARQGFVVKQSFNLTGSGIVRKLLRTYTSTYSSVQSNVHWMYHAMNSQSAWDSLVAGNTSFALTTFSADEARIKYSAQQFYTAPLFILGLAPIYHLDALGGAQLTLSPTVVADIYLGSISKWNDAKILSLNPGIALPATDIVLVHSKENSEATAAITRVLCGSSASFKQQVGEQTTLDGSLSLGQREVLVSTDAQIESAVSFHQNSLGFVGKVGKLQVPVAKMHRPGNQKMVELSSQSLKACQIGASLSPSAGATAFDFRLSSSTSCWPFALPFAVSLPAADVTDQCQNRSNGIQFVEWLFNGQQITEPMNSMGVAPTAAASRAAFHNLIYKDCSVISSSQIDDASNTVLIAVVVSLAVIVVLGGALFLAFRRHKAKQIMQHRNTIDRIQAELNIFMDSVVGMRSVVQDYSPIGISEFTHLRVDDISPANSGPTTPVCARTCQKEKYFWYWAEDSSRLSAHNSNMIYPPHWVMYAGSVAAELEEQFTLWQDGQRSNRYDTDLTDRISTTGTESKAFAADSGAKYTIDFEAMKQVNAQTGYARDVLRRVEATKPSVHVERLPASDGFANAEAMPKFPVELEEEPRLILRSGALVQLGKQRPDGWAYGSVVDHGTADESYVIDIPPLPSGILVSMETGWFPISVTAPPTANQLKHLSEQMGGGETAALCLKPPSHWNDMKDPLEAQMFEIKDGAEKSKVVDAFKQTLASGVQVVKVERIQNVSLWQSYAVKRQTMLAREDVAAGDVSQRIERIWLFHGTNDEVIPKILQQGFNRSFCGKNATMYGKGVYFARDAAYSSSKTYAVPSRDGSQRMFLCRVLVGEYCKGKKDALQPDVRNTARHTTYDSTVDNVRDPSMYITYHDAQAYPEYLVHFRQ